MIEMNILAKEKVAQAWIEVEERFCKARVEAEERFHKTHVEAEERMAKMGEEWKLLVENFRKGDSM